MAEVIVEGMNFKPPTVRIKRGEEVCWINKESKKHTATAEDDSFDLELPPPNPHPQPQCHTFNEPGTFPYFCTIHPHMKGTVIVE